MHQEVRDWLGELRRQYLEAFECDSVLECGSYNPPATVWPGDNVNGSVRGLFAAREYVGLDWRPGPGVDVVSLVHEYPGQIAWPGYEYQPGRRFDTVISTEMLEHDPHWRESVQRMIELVKGRTAFGLGGTLIITCAAPGRGEHELACSPLAEYYREIGGSELSDLVRKSFDRVRWWQMPASNPGGCSPAATGSAGLSVDTYLLGVGRW